MLNWTAALQLVVNNVEISVAVFLICVCKCFLKRQEFCYRLRQGWHCLLYSTSSVLGESYANGTSHDRELYLPTAIYSDWPVKKYSKQHGKDLDVGKTAFRGAVFRDFRLYVFYNRVL